ncbi:MAG: flavodoxin domain-containing protein [Coprobacillus sp.]
MSTIVIYKSATGFTKQYAKWIQEELDCDIKDLKDVSKQDYIDYERVIYGSSLMAGKLKSLDEVKKNACKELIVFGVGLTSQQDSMKIIDKLKNDNLSSQEQEKIPFFYFEGGIQYDKLGFVQKKMLKMIYKSLLKKENKTEEEIGMMNGLAQSSDHTDKNNIMPLISLLKKGS